MTDTRYAEAKHRFTEAATAVLRGDPDAVEQCTKALVELEQATREQQAGEDRANPGGRTKAASTGEGHEK